MIRPSPRLAAAALTFCLALGACGGGDDDGGDAASGDSVKSLRVLDYYANEPDKTRIAKLLDDCGKTAGVTIQREAVPGDTLIRRSCSRARPRPCPTC